MFVCYGPSVRHRPITDEVPGWIPGLSIWDLRCAKWHLEGSSRKMVPLPLMFSRFFILTFHSAGDRAWMGNTLSLSLSSAGAWSLTAAESTWDKIKLQFKNRDTPVPVGARSEAKALIVWTLRSRVWIPLKAWKFVLVFLCCAVLWGYWPCDGLISRPTSPAKCRTD
jgi:hypothetical protein